MLRRLPLGLTVALVLCAAVSAAGARGGGLVERKHSIDARIDRLHAAVAAARARESSLAGSIAAATSRIRTLEAQVGDVSGQLVFLERDLALHRKRLRRLTKLLRLQAHRYRELQREYALARLRFDRRLVAIYQDDEISTLDVLVAASSFTDLLERLDYARDVGAQDAAIAAEVRTAKREMRAAELDTRRTRTEVASATRVIAVRTSQVRGMRDRLVAEQDALRAERGKSIGAYAAAKVSERAAAGEADELANESAALTAQIQAAQAAAAARVAAAARAAQAAAPAPAPAAADSASAPPPTPAPPPAAAASSSGLIWPVSGPVTSPFGMRWGRMHTGIDIGVPYGTAIHAAASGIVIYAGWEGGYGNLVVIQHAGPLATAYAHQSSIAVTSGAHVSQGQVIGYVGCTGHCFGPHLHFEVRVNSQPVDPLGYL